MSKVEKNLKAIVVNLWVILKLFWLFSSLIIGIIIFPQIVNLTENIALDWDIGTLQYNLINLIPLWYVLSLFILFFYFQLKIAFGSSVKTRIKNAVSYAVVRILIFNYELKKNEQFVIKRVRNNNGKLLSTVKNLPNDVEVEYKQGEFTYPKIGKLYALSLDLFKSDIYEWDKNAEYWLAIGKNVTKSKGGALFPSTSSLLERIKKHWNNVDKKGHIGLPKSPFDVYCDGIKLLQRIGNE